MKRRLTIILALVLALAMSVSATIADYSSQGSITIPGASAIGKNNISSNLQTSYAQTSGSTNTYDAVTVTFYYRDSNANWKTETKNGSASTYIRVEPTVAPEGGYFYQVDSTHTASYNGNSGYVNLSKSIYGN